MTQQVTVQGVALLRLPAVLGQYATDACAADVLGRGTPVASDYHHLASSSGVFLKPNAEALSRCDPDAL